MYSKAITLLALLAIARSATIVLTGIARDFTPETNYDFESSPGDDRGIPQNVLDQDGKPVYNSSAPHPTVYSAESFSQWFRSVQGVNIEIGINITLTQSPDGVYTFDDPDFFPIDGKGFGNFGVSGHNYHFSTEFKTTFNYRGGDVFTFSGDDDVFVFINNKLVVDLGGIHEPESSTVLLDTLGLTVGQNYPLAVFQVERRTFGSSFRIDTTIALVPDDTTVPTNPGHEVSICEVVAPNFCPEMALNDARCPQLPLLKFPDGTTQSFESFNAISFGDFSNADGGDIEGRLAVRDNVHFYNGHYSVAYELRTGGASAIDMPMKYSFVVGGDAYFPSGAIYPLGNNVPYQAAQEFGFVGGAFQGADYIAPSIKGKCTNSGCLNNYFDQARVYYTAVQDVFFAVVDTGATFTIQNGEINVKCTSRSVSSVSLTLTAAQFNSISSYDTSSCNAEAQIVFNVPNPTNAAITFAGNNVDHRAEKVLFNIGGTGTIKVTTKVVGSILAPDATLDQPSGVIVGLVIAANIANSLQINRLNCVQIPDVPHNETALCPNFEDECAGLSFPLGGGVYSFRDFNVISFDSFTGRNGDIEGRLAVRNNADLGTDDLGYSIGYELYTAGGPDNSLPYSLVVGGNLIFPKGAVFPDGSGIPHAGDQEFIFAGGDVTAPEYLKNAVTGKCTSGAGCLNSYFDAAQKCYTGFSDKLSALSDNVDLSLIWGGAFVSCKDNTTSTYVLSLTESQLANITYYTTFNCDFQSQWVINVRGSSDVIFTGGSFPGVAGAIVYNVIGSGRTIIVRDTNLVGNLLSPNNILYQPNGVINGKVVVKNVTMSLQINREGQCPTNNTVVITVPIVEEVPVGSDILTILASSLRVNDVISVGGNNSHTVVDVSGNKVIIQPAVDARYSAGTLVNTRVSSLTTRPQVNSTYVAPTPSTPSATSSTSMAVEETSGVAQIAAAISLILLALAL